MSGAVAGRVRRADRHRRAVDGAGGRQEPPERRDRDLARGVRRRAGRRPRRRVHPRPAAAPGRRGVRAHRDLRRARRVAGWATCSPTPPRAPASRPGSAPPGTSRPCCATARTRTSRPRSTPAASSPSRGLAQATQLHGKEMSYNNYVDADAARRAAYDFDRAGRRDHQARQPVRHRGRRRRRRGAPEGARVRPGLGVRRRDRHQPAGQRGDGRAGRRGVHRGGRRARLRRRRGRGAEPQEEHPAARCRGPPTRGGVETRRVSGGLLMQARDASTPARRRRRRPRRAGRSSPASPASAGDARRPGLRLAGLPGGEVQRDPARLRRRLGRRRDGPGQPGRLLPPRGRAGRGAGRRLGRRLRRVLPLRRRPADPDRRAGHARSCSPAARCATRRSSQPRRPPA